MILTKMRGKIWKLGDDIDTDIIIPTQFLAINDIKEASRYAFYPLRPKFSTEIKRGDVIVAGRNFGCGSSREQAAEVLVALGVGCVIAKSFARIFFRNSINNGLLLIENKTLVDECIEGDNLSIDLKKSQIIMNEKTYAFNPLPKDILGMLDVGGLVAFTKMKNNPIEEK